MGKTWVAFIGAAIAWASPAATAVSAELAVRIEGLRNSDGVVSICVWSSGAAFPDCAASDPYGERTVRASALSEPVVFPNVPPGPVAISVLHDENANGKLDTNFVGIPREGVALSNNRVPKLRAPRFADAVFTFDGRSIARLTMSYW